MCNIEVEKRGFLTKDYYESIGFKLITLGAADIGENNSETIFFLLDNSQVKVQKNISKKIAKIAWKSDGNTGVESRKEIEVPININDFDSSVEIFSKILKNAQIFQTKQNRHDYRMNDIEIAIKYSDDWGYHIEIETIVHNSSDVANGLKLIKEFAQTINVTLILPDEEKAFVEKQIKSYRK
jgi:predicted adenylyl cyclase CyaB